MEAAALRGGFTRRPEAPSWGQVVGMVIAASVVATSLLVLAELALGAAGLVPGNISQVPGQGWPWRIDGAWAVLADLGPLLAAGAVFATAVMFSLGLTTGVRARRWPLALLAGGLGFVQVGVEDPGYVVVSGVLAFVAVVLLARHEALRPRGAIRWTARGRAAAAAAALALTTVSLSYGALHPLALNITSGSGPAVALRHGVSKPVPLLIENHGPLPARVVGISVARAPWPEIRRAVVWHEGTGLRMSDLRGPLAGERLRARDGSAFVELTLAAPGCTGGEIPVTGFDVRLDVGGRARTQRLRLSPPWRVACHR